MTVFAVHAPEGDAARPEVADRVVFVREGFSWFAALAPALYLLVHRAWAPLLLYGGVALGVAALVRLAGPPPGVMMGVVLALVLLQGLEGPALRQWSLRRKGLRHVASVVAPTREEAEQRFFAAWPARRPAHPEP